MSAYCIPNEHYILDRNIVSLIKDAVGGKEVADSGKKSMLDFLRSTDKESSKIYIFNSILEGQKGRHESKNEKIDTKTYETEILNCFFQKAKLDMDQIRDPNIIFTPIEHDPEAIVGLIKYFYEKWEEHAKSNSIPIHKRKDFGRDIINYHHIELNLVYKELSLPLLGCLSCIYGNNSFMRLLKPHDKDSYNAISDLNFISRSSRLKSTIIKLRNENQEMFQLYFSDALSKSYQNSSQKIKVVPLTLDKGLRDILEKTERAKIKTTIYHKKIMEITYDIERLSQEESIQNSVSALV